ncbi:hypothetical protein QYS49_30640 [Marivirga salinae]|uniref:Uncharacterized protein n=1 Tax=Marivirga salinarum TaxID=3059078 RepID=A0AA49GAQ8_9BACT|nr:hypothetical protein [Marivirga sp. BDSF4-3]WKK75753.2 hypothetical protein QYS49_30640 [Marivirga sp. BDSF4-3]
MNTFKNLLIYSISLIALFSLTAISCEDLSEEVTIDVPTDITKVIRLASEEAGGFEIVEPVDIASEEFNERREQMKDYKIESITFEVVDNLAEGSAVPNDLILSFDAGGTFVTTGGTFLTGTTLQAKLNNITPEMLDQVKGAIEGYILDSSTAGPVMEVSFGGNADAPLDYTITLVIEATIEAGVE